MGSLKAAGKPERTLRVRKRVSNVYTNPNPNKKFDLLSYMDMSRE